MWKMWHMGLHTLSVQCNVNGEYTKDLKYWRPENIYKNSIKMSKMSIFLYQMRTVGSIILYIGFLFGSLTLKMELTWNSKDLKDLIFLSYQFPSKYNLFFQFPELIYHSCISMKHADTISFKWKCLKVNWNTF